MNYKDIILTLPIIDYGDKEKDKMKFSLNKIWAAGPGSQWLRKDKRTLWHREIEDLIDDNNLKPINYPIEIEFIFNWKSRYLDCSNCGVMVKLIEDGFVEHGILKDDTNEFIRRIHIESKLIDKKERKNMEEDYVTIKLIPYIQKTKTNKEKIDDIKNEIFIKELELDELRDLLNNKLGRD